MPTSVVLSRFGQTAREALPFLSALISVFLGAVAWPLPAWGPIAPAWGLMALYYWAIHRPDIFGPFSVFILGLITDVLGFGPVGLSAFIFVGLHHVLVRQRRLFVGHTFAQLWGGFALVAISVNLVQALVVSFNQGQIVPLVPLGIQTFLTLSLFPLPAWVFIRLQRTFLSLKD